MENDKFTLDELFLCSEYPNFAFKLHKILNAYKLNKQKGYRIAKELFKSKKTFEDIIDSFSNKYINANDYLDDLYDILSSYDNEVKKLNQYVNNDALKYDNNKRKKLLDSIYDSGLSLLDYSFYNYVPISFASYFSDKLNRKSPKAIKISLRENNTMPILIDLLEKIIENKVDYVGYYELTKLDPYYLIKIAKDNNLYKPIVSDYIKKIRQNYRLNIENVLNGKMVIDEKEVSKEIKEQAINYLNSIDAPVDAVNYNTMVRRLINKSSK